MGVLLARRVAKGRPQNRMGKLLSEDTWGRPLMYWKRRKHSKGSYEVHAKVFGAVYLGSSCHWSLTAWEAVPSVVYSSLSWDLALVFSLLTWMLNKECTNHVCR